MNEKPQRAAFTADEWRMIERNRTPQRVQRFLHALPYNRELDGGSLRSFREVLRRQTAHCLEAALAAAVILEQHAYPPLLLSLASQDKLDHVIFVFRARQRWGAIGRSRDIGLHGRRPVYRTLRDLAWSYFDPYVDETGRLVAYGLTDLTVLGNYDWRFSPRNVWKVERHLCEIPHHKLHASERRYKSALARYRRFRQEHPHGAPDYFHDRARWML